MSIGIKMLFSKGFLGSLILQYQDFAGALHDFKRGCLQPQEHFIGGIYTVSIIVQCAMMFLSALRSKLVI